MYHLASTYYAMRQYDKAIKIYDDILALEPTHLNALYWKSIIANTKKNETSVESQPDEEGGS